VTPADGIADGALSDLRILDLSTRLSAAFAAKLMGDHGADVALVEPSEGHVLRIEPPFLDDVEGIERSLLHAYANQNKRSVVLDEGDLRRDDLMRAADIIVVSEPAEARHASEVAPGAIVLAVTPYGVDTAMADFPGNDLTTAAVTGWSLINGDQGEPPLRPTLHQSYYMAGTMAYAGTVAALVERDRNGTGQIVDVCELEPLVWVGAPGVLAAAYGDPASGMRNRPGVFRGPVASRDGHLSVTFSRPHFWIEAMRALGLDDLAEDPRYLDRTVRTAEAPELQERIEGALAQRDSWDLFEDMSRRRCTVGVVMTMKDLAENEHLAVRNAFAETVIDGREVKTLASPCEMSATPWTMRSPAPRLGEHTGEVLGEWLADREVAR